ncbi:hypothetical protein BSM4216_1224 [Bacillus smithii]|jgi:hypothetical protein|nr:hypothetical protein BSM4216_1224 [Bacillus smithii]
MNLCFPELDEINGSIPLLGAEDKSMLGNDSKVNRVLGKDMVTEIRTEIGLIRIIAE